MRILKILGLTLVAIFALTAVAASAASAHEVTAGAYEANVSGVQTTANVMSNGVREISCANATLTGTLTAASPDLTITPAYANCTGNAGTTVTVDINGCTYTLAPTAGSGVTNNLTVGIVCPGSSVIEFTLWAAGKAHTEAKLCTLTVGSQTITTGAKYTNLAGTSGIDLNLALNTVVLKRTEGTAANCGAAERTTGTYTGTIVFTAKHAGVATSLDAN